MHKSKLILLHGALASSKQMDKLSAMLASDFNAYTLNFSGHGGSPLPEKFSCDLFANDILHYIKQLPEENLPVNLLGFSMGGYIAVTIALHHAHLVNKVFTIGTKYKWDKESGEKEIEYINIPKMKQKIPQFCEQLKRIHSPQSWEKIALKIKEMMVEVIENPPLKEHDFTSLTNKILIAVGDRDKTADVQDSWSIFNKIKNSDFLVLPDTSHPFEKVDLKKLTPFIIDFFS